MSIQKGMTVFIPPFSFSKQAQPKRTTSGTYKVKKFWKPLGLSQKVILIGNPKFQ